MTSSASQAPSDRQARRTLPAGPVPYRPYTLSPHDTGWLIEDVWPSLYFGPERVGEMSRKVDRFPWARRAVDLMTAEADYALSSAPHVPMEPCGWRHDFYSRRTGAHLLYEPDHPDALLDPTTGRRECDAAQRRGWALLTHERTFRMLRSVGFLYQLTGEERYAAWVSAGMRLAQEYFGHAEFHRGRALYFQSLYDAGILGLLANAYELTSASQAYTDTDHRSIREHIFAERVPEVADFAGKGPSNMDCFVAMALVSAGRAIGRDDWIRQGTEGFLALDQQLARSVPGDPDRQGEEPDGFWVEGSTFYHLYSACTLVTLREEARRSGTALDTATEDRFAAMLQAPVVLADDRLRVPTLGDLADPRTMNLAAYRHLYEYAAGQVDPDRFGPVLAAQYRYADAARTDLAALAYGPDELTGPSTQAAGSPPPRTVPARKSRVLPQARIVVFEAGAPHPMWLLFRSGTFRGGHDHPDRLSLALHAYGVPISPDPGTPGYSLREALGHYFRSTLAHNTVLVDEESLTAEATLSHDLDTDPQSAHGEIRADGVTIRRTVSFEPPRIVIVDEFEAKTERRFGLVFHAYGDVTVHSSGSATAQAGDPDPLPEGGPWTPITDRRYERTAGPVGATWRPAPSVRLHLLSQGSHHEPVEVITGKAPGQPFADGQGLLYLRTHGRTHRRETVLQVTDDSIPGAGAHLEPFGSA